MKASEIEIKVIKPIASTGKVEREGGETLERCDGERDVEHNFDNKIERLMSTLRAKWVAMKMIIEDQLLRHGFSEKLDRLRAYQVWPGKNIFFFYGRFICGPDPRGLILTTASIFLSSWIFARYVGEDLPNHSALVVAFSVILTFVVLVILILVSATDPGIVPRNDQASSEGDYIRSKKVIINGVEMKSKYCRICKIFRSPRSCHCAICDNCVERFDHHSPWIGQCIALRNHQFYLAFLIFALIFFVYIFAFSCWRLHQRMLKNHDGFSGMVKSCPEALALAAFGLIATGFVGALTIYHVYLIAINETAYENFRQRYLGCKNPYDKGILSNFKEALFVAVPPSRVDFRAEVTPGPQLETIGTR